MEMTLPEFMTQHDGAGAGLIVLGQERPAERGLDAQDAEETSGDAHA